MLSLSNLQLKITKYLKKFLTFILILVIAPLLGGIYGIIHDQLTFTISPEYYTKFKFYQFGLLDEGNEADFPNPRFQVSIVGFMATWWMGLLIGLILGLFGLMHQNSRQMFRATMKAIVITVIVAFATGLIGLLIGQYYLADTGFDEWLPTNLVDKKNFVAVGSMHNFSYLGGLIGLIAGIIFSVKEKTKKHKVSSE